jgi:hypothetical protein
MTARGAAMLAVAVQLSACAVAAPRSELELEPEANAGAERVRTTHVANARDLMLTTKSSPRLDERGKSKWLTLRPYYKTLKRWKDGATQHRSRPRSATSRPQRMERLAVATSGNRWQITLL